MDNITGELKKNKCSIACCKTVLRNTTEDCIIRARRLIHNPRNVRTSTFSAAKSKYFIIKTVPGRIDSQKTLFLLTWRYVLLKSNLCK